MRSCCITLLFAITMLGCSPATIVQPVPPVVFATVHVVAAQELIRGTQKLANGVTVSVVNEEKGCSKLIATLGSHTVNTTISPQCQIMYSDKSYGIVLVSEHGMVGVVDMASSRSEISWIPSAQEGYETALSPVASWEDFLIAVHLRRDKTQGSAMPEWRYLVINVRDPGGHKLSSNWESVGGFD